MVYYCFGIPYSPVLSRILPRFHASRPRHEFSPYLIGSQFDTEICFILAPPVPHQICGCSFCSIFTVFCKWIFGRVGKLR